MYKVFIENREVNFSQANTLPEGISLKNDEVRTYKKWLLPVVRKREEGSVINVICEDLEKEMSVFFKDHKAINAAGGIVQRAGEYLFIKRHGLWDLPKGKVEKDETIEDAAVREVEEECGISGVQIKEHIMDTFHTYEMKGKQYLKRTYWYAMSYDGTTQTKPQKEEGITDVKWIDEEEMKKVLKNTYPSISKLIQFYLENEDK